MTPKKILMTPDAQQSTPPFDQMLAADEPLLWLARPNAEAFRAQKAKIELYICGFSGVTILLGGLVLRNYVYAVLGSIIVLWGVISANGTARGDEEWNTIWYALTPQRLLKQSLGTKNQGYRRITQVALTDLRHLRLRKKYIRFGTCVGTITCYTPARYVEEYFTLDSIENPDEVLRLIENARAQLPSP